MENTFIQQKRYYLREGKRLPWLWNWERRPLFSLDKYPGPHSSRVEKGRAVKVSGSGLFESDISQADRSHHSIISRPAGLLSMFCSCRFLSTGVCPFFLPLFLFM